jgi:hypothetical protein
MSRFQARPFDPAPYSGATPQYGTRRGTTTQVPRTGIAGSLSAPGLAAMPIDDRGAVMARQILNVIGGIGETVGMVGKMQEARNREQMQIAKEQEMEQRQAQMEQRAIEAADKGTGAQMANNNELRFVDQIRKGEVVFDKPEDAIAAWKARGEELQLNPSQMAGWMAGSQRFIAESYDFNNRKTAEAQVSLAENYKAAVISGELTPEQAKVLAGFTFTKQGVVDQNAVDRFFLDIAKDASVLGNEELVNGATSQLSDQNKYTIDNEKNRINLTAWKRNQEEDRDNQIQDIFASMQNNAVPESQMRETVRSWEKQGYNPRRIKQMLDTIDSLERDSLRQLQDRMDKQEIVSFNNGIIREYWTRSQAGNAYTILDSQEITLSSGNKHTLKQAEIEDGLHFLAQEHFRTQFENDPNRQLIEYVKWSTNNGLQPKEITASLQRAAAAINTEMTVLPEIAKEGYRRYKLLAEFSPNFIHSLPIGDEKAIRAYKVASHLQELGVYPNELEALRASVRYIDDRAIPVTPSETKEKIINDVASKIGASKNDNGLISHINKDVNLLMEITKDPKKTAEILVKNMEGNVVLDKSSGYVTILSQKLTDKARTRIDDIKNIVATRALGGTMTGGTQSVLPRTVSFGEAKPENFFLRMQPDGYELVSKITGLPYGGLPISFREMNSLADVADKNWADEVARRGKIQRRSEEEAAMQIPPAGFRQQ